jgi:hypothetical protein
VDTEDIRKWNRLKTGVSRGMVLRIYTIGGAPETSALERERAQKKTEVLGRGSGLKPRLSYLVQTTYVKLLRGRTTPRRGWTRRARPDCRDPIRKPQNA